MTGKACIYQGDIVNSGPYKYNGFAFMLMPFNSTLDEVYRAQLEPCLSSVMEKVNRADDIAKTGYVICEKICKQIQLADLVCAELSCDNPNVLYELGLAYALERSIALFFKKKLDRKDIIKKLGLMESDYNIYYSFDLLNKEEIKLWKLAANKKRPLSADDKTVIILADSRKFLECVNGQTLSYSIDGLCRGAINKTLDVLDKELKTEIKSINLNNRKTITFKSGEVKGYFEDRYSGDKKKEAISFIDVESYIRNASSVVICTHDSEPLSYFWLGFSHGLQKDVIPITVSLKDANTCTNKCVEKEREGIKDGVMDYDRSEPSLPFDIRALWHISFQYSHPNDLHEQLANVLKILIHRFKDKQYRRLFWYPFIEQDKVSVYVGSIELDTEDKSSKRHVIGEWDYRTVSELTGFFASIKETMKVVIQAPTFQLKQEKRGVYEEVDKYSEELKKKLVQGNSIILATTDVNDMTEVALAVRHNISIPFKKELSEGDQFNGIIAIKSSSCNSCANGDDQSLCSKTVSTFCRFVNNDKSERGFVDIARGREVNSWKGHYYTYYDVGSDSEDKRLYNAYYAHVAKFKIADGKPWAIVLQGVTGPATLGLVQALTGGINEQFTIFSKDQDYQMKLLNAIAKEADEGSLKKALNNPAGTESVFKEYLNEIVKSSYDEDDNLKEVIANIKNKNITSRIFHEQSEMITNALTEGFDSNDAVEAVIRIYTTISEDKNHDDRLIIWWDFVMSPRIMKT
jgi:nucleoside 2-deoxyribosyltransferase